MNAIARFAYDRSYAAPFDAAWNQMQIQVGQERSFNPRLFLDAMRQLPADRGDADAVRAWIAGPLRRFFPHTRCVGLYGSFAQGRIAIKHRLAVDYSPDKLKLLEEWVASPTQTCVAHWLQTRRPILIDCEQPPPFVTSADRALFAAKEPGSIAAHGIVDARTEAGLFFYFAGVEKPLGEGHVQAMDLIAPVLNGLQMDVLANEVEGADKLANLTPRQREAVCYILAGLSNGRIAEIMQISEKTIRNTVSEIYARLAVVSRGELFALLRA